MIILAAIIAVVLAVFGIANILSGDVIWGILLLVAAAAIGPGGWAIWK